MYTMKETYIDFDGNERTEEFQFNLTEQECIDLQISSSGGIDKKVRKIIQAQNQKEIVETIKQIIDVSYGEKSLDGKYFRKSSEILDNFKSTPAYSQIFMKLATNDEEAAKFVVGVVPANLKEPVIEAQKNMNNAIKEAESLSDVSALI